MTADTYIQRHSPPAQLHLHSNYRERQIPKERIIETKSRGKKHTQINHVTPHYFVGYLGISSDPEEIIKPFMCQAVRGSSDETG